MSFTTQDRPLTVVGCSVWVRKLINGDWVVVSDISYVKLLGEMTGESSGFLASSGFLKRTFGGEFRSPYVDP